ncbi:MAG: selenoprotein W-related protein [Gemmatimonadetes bacterium]|nr:selenoprotein W-related protein [Gemmatimonadota bacterium]
MSKPRVEIEYCTGCRWMLRAAWMQQELLVTFEQELESVSLKPGRDGVFEVRVDQARVWSRVEDGGFPDIRELKQRVRDLVNPDRALGHTDRAHGA